MILVPVRLLLRLSHQFYSIRCLLQLAASFFIRRRFQVGIILGTELFEGRRVYRCRNHSRASEPCYEHLLMLGSFVHNSPFTTRSVVPNWIQALPSQTLQKRS